MAFCKASGGFEFRITGKGYKGLDRNLEIANGAVRNETRQKNWFSKSHFFAISRLSSLVFFVTFIVFRSTAGC